MGEATAPKRTTSVHPRQQAIASGVKLSSSRLFTSTEVLRTSNFTTSSRPFSQAVKKGVTPVVLGRLQSTASFRSNSLTTAVLPR